ncbi:MAG: ribulose-phosphate 3-epimerase [Anaerolineae bacterium]|nr:ribulose-phosphate 3-epimerase [Anaerolineae bacterium]
MTEQFIIAPSILSSDFLHLGDVLQTCKTAGADWIHIDVMDGQFVPNLTMGAFIVEACKRGTDLPLDVHLMVENPENLLQAFAKAGAANLTVHVETCPHLHSTLQEIKSLGCKAGVTLNPGTPAESIFPVLNMVDLVLIMSVNPGFSGQSFLPESVAKVAKIREKLDALGSSAWLEVDGGISSETLPKMIAAGANAFVAATAIFKHSHGIATGIAALRDL